MGDLTMETPFWEANYKDDSISAFGTEPNASIVEFQQLFSKTGSVLDVGCGEGQNALYLAGLAQNKVDAFDISENAIAKLKRIASVQGRTLNAWAQDLRQFTFGKSYDLVMSFGTLHFVEKAHWRKLLQSAKDNTNSNGIHIIQIFTNVLPASPDIAPFAAGLADDGELRELYGDWEILQFLSYTFEDEHPGVPKHLHSSNKIVAQKK